MRISILLTTYPDLVHEVEHDPILKNLVKTWRLELDWPSKEFDALTRIWSGKSHATARLNFSVSDELLSETQLFEVWRQEVAYSLSNSDSNYLRQHQQTGPLLEGASSDVRYFPKVRYFPEVKLTNAKVRDKRISSLDAPEPIYFIQEEEAKAWCEENFSGLGLGPVYRHRGRQVHSGVSLIVPNNVMGPMVMGNNVIAQNFVHQNLRYEFSLVTGFLVYSHEEIEKSKDFNFTCEPVCTYGYPKMLVSRKFVDFYRKRGLSGWVFRPVLEFGGPFHQEFVETFERFMVDWRTGHSENRISE